MRSLIICIDLCVLLTFSTGFSKREGGYKSYNVQEKLEVISGSHYIALSIKIVPTLGLCEKYFSLKLKFSLLYIKFPISFLHPENHWFVKFSDVTFSYNNIVIKMQVDFLEKRLGTNQIIYITAKIKCYAKKTISSF